MPLASKQEATKWHEGDPVTRAALEEVLLVRAWRVVARCPAVYAGRADLHGYRVRRVHIDASRASFRTP
jgi:hypothetical protein